MDLKAIPQTFFLVCLTVDHMQLYNYKVKNDYSEHSKNVLKV